VAEPQNTGTPADRVRDGPKVAHREPEAKQQGEVRRYQPGRHSGVFGHREGQFHRVEQTLGVVLPQLVRRIADPLARGLSVMVSTTLYA